VVVIILSHPLDAGIVSMPVGFASLYVVPSTTIVTPLPLHDVESIELIELGKNTSVVVIILSHPLDAGIVSMPVGFASLYVVPSTTIVTPLPLHDVESIELEELGKNKSVVVIILSHPLDAGIVSMPVGFASLYVVPSTTIVTPLPLHDVESIELEELGKKVRNVLIILSHPATPPPIKVSIPIGVPSS